MKIAIAGTGYVGLSIATLLAQHNKVVAVDVVPDKVDKINSRVSPIKEEYIEKYIEENPTFKGITRRYAKPNKLTPDCIAQILLSANIFGRFKLENNTYLLGMYQEEGPDVGIYKLLESEDDCLELYRLMFEFDPGLKKPEREEIKQKLLIDAPLKKENSNPKLIALNNGIWFCSNNVSKENMDNFFLNYRNSESREFVFTKKKQERLNICSMISKISCSILK